MQAKETVDHPVLNPKPGYREDLEDPRAKAPINLGYILVQSSH